MSIFYCHTCGDLSDADDGCYETADGMDLICVECGEEAETLLEAEETA